MLPRAEFVHEPLASIDSTNAELLRRAQTRSIHARAISADVQTAGRGQRGRRWHATAGDALLLSAGWRFDRGERLDGLSLAVGVIVARAAQRFASERITLKWPNDLLLDDSAKLGGILIETLPLDDEARVAVIGIGINVRPPQFGVFDRAATRGDFAPDALPPGALLAGFQPRHADGASIVRDALRQSILDELATRLPVFASDGFRAFRDDWWAHRAYANARVRILAPDASHASPASNSSNSSSASNAAQELLSGVIADIDETGALVIDDSRTLHTLHSGTLSIRPITA
jgi:BirA family transcriptional regulator, biotin operon repressor / biotin---[acetyl-CoA-carboxylase] ligase